MTLQLMTITITATLTEEQLNILGTYKWYSEWNKEEFIRDVYQSMIINDATNVFIDYSRKQTEQARLDEVQL